MIKEFFKGMLNKTQTQLKNIQHAFKSGWATAKAAMYRARIKGLKDVASDRDMADIMDALNGIDGVEFTKSGFISKKGLTQDKAEAIERILITPTQYKEMAHDRQMAGFDKIIKLNRVNAAFERIMNAYYTDWSGKNRIRNSTIDQLPPDFQEKLEKMMSNMGTEYAWGSDNDWNNIDDEFWDMLEEFLEQYELLI